MIIRYTTERVKEWKVGGGRQACDATRHGHDVCVPYVVFVMDIEI